MGKEDGILVTKTHDSELLASSIEKRFPGVITALIEHQRQGVLVAISSQNNSEERVAYLSSLVDNPSELRKLVIQDYIQAFIGKIRSFAVFCEYLNGILPFTDTPDINLALSKVIVPYIIQQLHDQILNNPSNYRENIAALRVLLLDIPQGVKEEIISLQLDLIHIIEAIRVDLEGVINQTVDDAPKNVPISFEGLAMFYDSDGMYNQLKISIDTCLLSDIESNYGQSISDIGNTIGKFQDNRENQKSYVLSYPHFITSYDSMDYSVRVASSMDTVTDILYLDDSALLTEDEKNVFEKEIEGAFKKKIDSILRAVNPYRHEEYLTNLLRLFSLLVEWCNYSDNDIDPLTFFMDTIQETMEILKKESELPVNSASFLGTFPLEILQQQGYSLERAKEMLQRHLSDN